MLSSKKGYELVQLMPIEKILVETDGPFGNFKTQDLFAWSANIAIAILVDIWRTNISEAENILRLNLFSVVAYKLQPILIP